MAFTPSDSLSFVGTGTSTSVHLNNVANGSASFVAISVNQSTTNRIASVTDSSGNLYARAASFAGTNISVELWYALNAQLTNVTTVTVTPSINTDIWAAVWCVVPGIAANSAYDRSVAASGTGTTIDSSAFTLRTRQPNEFIIGIGGQANNRPYTSGSGFTSVSQASNGTSATILMEQQSVSVMGTYNSSCTIDLSSNWVQATYSFSDTPMGQGGVGNKASYISVGDGMSRSEGAY